MNYCVLRDTIKVIDGSDNSNDVMMQNAINAGFVESEVEILTEEEYLSRVASEPKPPAPKTELEQLKEDNANLNLQYIDLFELLIAQGVI